MYVYIIIVISSKCKKTMQTTTYNKIMKSKKLYKLIKVVLKTI